MTIDHINRLYFMYNFSFCMTREKKEEREYKKEGRTQIGRKMKNDLFPYYNLESWMRLEVVSLYIIKWINLTVLRSYMQVLKVVYFLYWFLTDKQHRWHRSSLVCHLDIKYIKNPNRTVFFFHFRQTWMLRQITLIIHTYIINREKYAFIDYY